MTREDMLTILRGFSRPSMEDKEAIAAQIQADGETIARLESERNEAQGDADMANDALRCVRNELQADPAIPVAAFVDDHVRNAVVMLGAEREKVAIAEARIETLEKILGLHCRAISTRDET